MFIDYMSLNAQTRGTLVLKRRSRKRSLNGIACITLGVLLVASTGSFTLPATLGWCVALAGIILILSGFGTLASVDRLIFDKKRKTIDSQSRLLLIKNQKSFPFDSFDCITMTMTAPTYDRDGAEEERRVPSYDVCLSSGSGGAAATLLALNTSDFVRARQAAETIARFLDITMKDNTSGALVIRQPNELDLSYKKRLQRAGIVKELPPTPAEASVKVEREGQQTSVQLPRKGFYMSRLFGGLLAAVAILGLTQLIPALLAAVLAALIVILYLVDCTSSTERFTVDRQVLRRYTTRFGVTIVKQLRLDELEEFVLVDRHARELEKLMLRGESEDIQQFVYRHRHRDHQGIIARSDRSTLRLGMDYDLINLCYAYCVLRQAIID